MGLSEFLFWKKCRPCCCLSIQQEEVVFAAIILLQYLALSELFGVNTSTASNTAAPVPICHLIYKNTALLLITICLGLQWLLSIAHRLLLLKDKALARGHTEVMFLGIEVHFTPCEGGHLS